MDIIQEMIVPVKKESLVDQIHNAILEIIIQEDVTQESVFTEGKLVQQFQVSKATVREALVRLCNEDMLKSIPRYGYVIVRMGEKEILDLVDFRILLEVAALKQAFERIAQNHIADLEALLEHQRQRPTIKVWDTWQKNIEFHCQLISYANNAVFVEYLRKTMERQAVCFAQRKWTNGQTFDDYLDESPHRNILDALHHNDLERAAKCLQEDIIGAFSEHQSCYF